MALGAFIAQWVYASAAMAEEGYPSSWQLSLQNAVTPMGERLHDFHKDLNYIIFAIAIFVIVLIIYTMIRFREKANPTPSQTTHNVILEIFWTIIPIGILFYIVFPSFSLLFYQHKTPEFDMTLKVTGYQWYWGYEYPDHDGINFLSYMKKENELEEGELRLLATDNPVVLPTGKNIQIIITAADVLHSWTVPSFSVKRDAVPGRLNETWVRIDKPGTYYGQCSEICGKDHAYMPIMIKAVTPEEFDEWLVTAKEEFAYNGNSISTQGTMTADAATLGATAQ